MSYRPRCCRRYTRLPQSLAIAVLAVVCATPGIDAQEVMTRRVSTSASPLLQSWTFGDGALQDGIAVSAARQLAIPVSLQFPIGNRVRVEATGAFMQATVEGIDSVGGARNAQISGPTDVRIRSLVRFTESVAITVGINVPTGNATLNGDGLLVMRTIGAPSLGASVPTLGIGFGATAGMVVGQRVGRWAVGGAVSAEQRSAYTPFEAALFGAETELRPGNALHLSLGASGFVGESRLNLVSGLDLFSGDEVEVRPTNVDATTSAYTLGPQVTSGISLDVATTRARSLRVSASHRWRGRFTGPDDEKVAGSAAHFIESSVDAVLGRPSGAGFVVGVNARYASPLDLETAFITSGVSGVGGTLGINVRRGAVTWEPIVRLFVGSLSAGDASPSMTSLTVALSVSR